MIDMAKKKKGRARKGKSINVWVDPRLRAALDAVRKGSRRNLTQEMEIALERYLTDLGAWPPQEGVANGERK